VTLPQLHLTDWRPTKDTLYLYAQIVGEIRLATMAPSNHLVECPDVRRRPRPQNPLLAFCQTACKAGARLARWDTTCFQSTRCPTPDQLRRVRASAAADLGRTRAGGS
jgi:hypothetical protein